MQHGDSFKRKAPIKKRSPKRKKDERTYKEQAREFFDDAVNNGTNQCYFCGEEVKTFQGLHHLKGRTNDYLIDKEWWGVVHNDCHVWKYHQASYEQRIKEPWWSDFMMRLKSKSPELHRKEIAKGEKYLHSLNRSLFEDEEEDY